MEEELWNNGFRYRRVLQEFRKNANDDCHLETM